MTLTVDKAVSDAEMTLRRAELSVRHKLHGFLQGDYRGALPGPGSDPNDGRTYQPGDDVRRIDWSLSARSNQIQVRDTIAERELETWVVVDGSASMDFGTGHWLKRDLAAAATSAYGFLSSRLGSRFGVVIANPDGATTIAPGAGNDQVRLAMLQMMSRKDAPAGAADLDGAIEMVRRFGRRPGAVVLISDFLDDSAWVRSMRGLSQSARTIAVEVRDDREGYLPDVGLLTLVDPETGRLKEVNTSSPRFRLAYERAAKAQRDAIAHTIRSAGAEHLVLNTSGDWVSEIMRHHLAARAAARPMTTPITTTPITRRTR